MQQIDWAALSNVFMQFEPVAPSRLNDWFVVRPDSPLEMLVRQLNPTRVPQHHLLVGQTGSGKSSELAKLARELTVRYDSFCVMFDVVTNVNIEQANPVEVLFLMGAATFKVAEAALPADRQPDRGLLEKLKEGLETLVRTQTEDKQFKIDLGKLLAGLVVFGAAGLVGAAGAAPVVKKYAGLNPFRFFSGTDTKVVRKLEVEPHVEGMIEALNAILDDVRAKTGRPLVLLVDGLDRLRDPEVIRLNFVERGFLNGPKCSVVYVGPLDLYYTPEFDTTRLRFPLTLLPALDVVERSGTISTWRDEPSYECMRQVVYRRLGSLHTDRNAPAAGHQLASEATLPVAVLDLLIRGSGGLLRDLIRLVQSAAIYAEIAGNIAIALGDARKALNDLRRQLRVQLTPYYQELLKVIRTTHQRVDGSECDQLLRNNLVLIHRNEDDIQFDVHSLLADDPWW